MKVKMNDTNEYKKMMAELSAEEMEAYEKDLWNAPSLPIPDSDVDEALESFRMRIGRMHRRIAFKLVAAAAAVAAVFLGIGMYTGAKAGAETAEAVTIQYGGSMNAKNAAELLSKVNVDGGLIGGASLKSADFGIIVAAAK